MLRVCCPAHRGTRAAATRHTRSRASSFIQRAPPAPPLLPLPGGAGAGAVFGFPDALPGEGEVFPSVSFADTLIAFAGEVRALPSAAGAGTGSMLAASASKSWSICCDESSTGSTTSVMETVALNLRLWVLTEEIPPAPSRRSRSNTPGNRGILFEKQNVFARSAIIEVHPYKTMR